MKKTSFILVLCFALFLALPLGVCALTVKSGNSVYVAKDETIKGNYYAAGNTISVEGKVEGDVICAGQTININGQVDGDVICAGQTININGNVGGSVRTAGNSISINGKVARNAMTFGASIYVGPDATIGWDMLLAGATGEIRGAIAGDLYGGASNVVIAGKIGKEVRLRLDERIQAENQGFKNEKFEPLSITKDAVVGGGVTYTAGKRAVIEDGAKITGQVTYNEPKAKPAREAGAVFAWFKLVMFFAALVVGLVLTSLWRDRVKAITDRMFTKISASIGWGIVIMFLTPIIAIMLMITLIGIPLSLILLALWLIALYVSKILVGITIGRSIMDKIWTKRKDSLTLNMIVGVALIWLICWIPVIGWLAGLLAIWWGLGGLWLAFKKP